MVYFSQRRGDMIYVVIPQESVQLSIQLSIFGAIFIKQVQRSLQDDNDKILYALFG